RTKYVQRSYALLKWQRREFAFREIIDSRQIIWRRRKSVLRENAGRACALTAGERNKQNGPKHQHNSPDQFSAVFVVNHVRPWTDQRRGGCGRLDGRCVHSKTFPAGTMVTSDAFTLIL